MRKLVCGLLMLVMTGCSTPSSKEFKPTVVPDELKDCQFFWIQEKISGYRVIRCPNSATTTSYTEGKTRKTISVIEK